MKEIKQKQNKNSFDCKKRWIKSLTFHIEHVKWDQVSCKNKIREEKLKEKWGNKLYIKQIITNITKFTQKKKKENPNEEDTGRQYSDTSLSWKTITKP